MIEKLFFPRPANADAPEKKSEAAPSDRVPAGEIAISDLFERGAEEYDLRAAESWLKYAAVTKLFRAQSESAEANLRCFSETFFKAQGNGAGAARQPSRMGESRVLLAKELISENGALGVKAVSDRIAGLAVAFSGGDPEKLDEMRAAIDEGFQKAASRFGGALPEICNDTYDEVMRKLDEWEAGTEAL